MAKRFTFFLLITLFFSLKTSAQIARNGFEGDATDNWSFAPSPAPYNVSADEDFWTDTTVTPQISPFAGTRFWFMRDLDNPNGGFNGFHTLDFQAVDLSGANAGQFSFAYWTTEYEAGDSLGYIIAFDNGTTWDMANYIDLNRNTGAWSVVQFPIPPGSPQVRLRLMAKQNGGSDWAGFDEVQIEEGLPPAVIGFDKKTAFAKEDAGTVNIQLNIASGNVFPSSVKVSIVAASTAVAGVDHAFTETTVIFPENSTAPLQVQVPVSDDILEDGGRYLILQLSDFQNAEAGSNTEFILLLADNDAHAPAAQADPFVKLRHVSSVLGHPAGGSAEISAYDPASQRLFITNITKNTLDILNFSNPVAPTYISSIDMTPFGGGINSVAVKNGIVAAAVQGNSTAENGKVVFFDANGTLLNSVNVGNLPDMVIFSNDGSKALTANEGEPNSDYSIDPLGSVSVIDLSPGIASLTDGNVTTLTFESFDSQIDDLRAAGVRIYGPNATVGSDFEPEYICVSPDDKTALVTLQENNAIATIDLTTLQVTGIQPLGYKDLSLTANAADVSDQAPGIFFANWPVKGMYQPDAIECFTIGGVTYALTANEGDAREYSALTEGARLSTVSLDPTAFPNANYLKKSELLGRLNVTKSNGDTDGDGDLDEIYTAGGRSFSIWNTATGALVWDSGNDLEQITAEDPTWGAYFNASNGATPALKNRSDDKGPEPEGVVVAEIEGRTFAFLALERIGGIAAYEVSDPAAPQFIQYINTRTPTGGDLGPEGIIFIPKNESPNGRNLLVLSNEISGTVSIFQVELDRTSPLSGGQGGGGGFTLETFDYTPTVPIAEVNGDTVFEGGISGLHYIPGTELEFFANSDRGPNADASSHPNATGTTLLFLAPEFAPKITRFKAENGAWTVQSIEPIRRPDGSTITGLPLPAGAGNTGEIAWADTTPTVLSPDIWGMDTEGVVEDNFGNLWLVDEYGASVWKLNKQTKQVIKRYTPFPTQPEDAALPAVIGKRRPNRGFEGVAITPNGKVYAFIQSVADNPNTAAGNSGRLLRLVEIDPETDAVRQFAYEIQPTTGQIRTRDWKIGDLVAVNNDEFLLVEHAERNGWNTKNIYKINIANATPLTTEDYGGQTMEQVGTAAGIAAFGVTVVQKTLVLDLLEAGWDLSHDKPEGVTIINDSTIAVVNDNDFGISSPSADGSIVLTGKTTRLYIYGLPQPLGYVSPYCSFELGQAAVSTCEGEAATLDAGAGFAAYAWSDGSTGQTLAASTAGIYAVTVTNGVGCKAIDSVAVSVLSNSVITIVETLCFGNSIIVNGTIYDASNPIGTEVLQNANISGCDSIVNIQLSFLPLDEQAISATICQGETYQLGNNSYSTAATYTATFQNAAGCDSIVTLQLAVNPVPTVNLGADQSICEGETATLNAGAGFAAYTWYDGSTTQTLVASNTGDYAVTVTAANGCTDSDIVFVLVKQAPDVNLGEDRTICEGETAALNAGAGNSAYLWSNGATTQTITATVVGNYAVTVTASNGCTGEDAVQVNVLPAPQVDLGKDTTVVLPLNYLLDAGAGFDSYFWSDGSTGQTLMVTESGTFSVTVLGSNGCEASDEITVTVLPSGANEAMLAGNLTLFPNPTSGWVNLRFEEFAAGRYSVGVFDLTGRVVLRQTLDIQGAGQTTKIDLSSAAKGAYFVKVASEEGVLVRKVVVE